MKIFKITNDIFSNQINKNSGNWDDIMNIPDIADTFTLEEYEKYNPLCYNFWLYRIENSNIETVFYNNFYEITEIYKKNSST